MNSNQLKTLVLTSLLGLLFIACDQRNNEQALKQLFDQATFDTTIKQDQPFCDSIKQLAVAHIDTLFKFRNSRNKIDYYDENGKVLKQQADESEYSFFYNPITKGFVDYSDNPALPDFLVPKFRSAFEQAGREIGSFTLWNDSTIEFGIGGFYDKKTNADVVHSLVWKTRYRYEPQFLAKDTIIALGWTYYITVDERQE